MGETTSSSVARILIGDDQADVLKALRLLLRPDGYDVVSVSSAAETLGIDY